MFSVGGKRFPSRKASFVFSATLYLCFSSENFALFKTQAFLLFSHSSHTKTDREADVAVGLVVTVLVSEAGERTSNLTSIYFLVRL